MHSSRMCTYCWLTVSRGGGGVQGMCVQKGGVSGRGGGRLVGLGGGVWGWCVQGRECVSGVVYPGGGVSMGCVTHLPPDRPPSPCEQNDRQV